ncbi:hypothetical protein F0562_033112 [Nyssa sinensis]|uniref:Uncharacterized protein n=1 Tax=Nyssa sinensis TaxID=561372 RepID=A0A5J5AQE6_9ASTE|nr:hypothetical protein F0562_033112 [Nyssa sinensis]
MMDCEDTRQLLLGSGEIHASSDAVEEMLAQKPISIRQYIRLGIWVHCSLQALPLLWWEFKASLMGSCPSSNSPIGEHSRARPSFYALNQTSNLCICNKLPHAEVPSSTEDSLTLKSLMVDFGHSTRALHSSKPFLQRNLDSLEIWYVQGLTLISGLLPNPTIFLDSISICLNYWTWEMEFMLGLSAAARIQALILSPTREVASQTEKFLTNLMRC